MQQMICIVLWVEMTKKTYVIPSKKLVIVRMGEAAENVNFALSNFDFGLWGKINVLI
jgi:hypothetical protein